jgi:glycosyltransferase involved in cell wall biosynthesis
MVSKLSAVVVVHNEESQLADCLAGLGFADELVVVLDKCTDGSKTIAQKYTSKIVEGSWDLEGDRRNLGLDACTGDWIVEVDADERVTPELAAEIRQIVNTSPYDYHHIPVDNYIGDHLVRYGWGGSFGKGAYVGLFRKGAKIWGPQRVHPALTLTGKKGPFLENRLLHYVDRDISDMIRRLDGYSTKRALDLRDSGKIGTAANNYRRLFSRFFRCYVRRKGYKEGGYGFLIALFAGLFPLISYYKAKYEK